jgi:hypothetical protein
MSGSCWVFLAAESTAEELGTSRNDGPLQSLQGGEKSISIADWRIHLAFWSFGCLMTGVKYTRDYRNKTQMLLVTRSEWHAFDPFSLHCILGK